VVAVGCCAAAAVAVGCAAASDEEEEAGATAAAACTATAVAGSMNVGVPAAAPLSVGLLMLMEAVLSTHRKTAHTSAHREQTGSPRGKKHAGLPTPAHDDPYRTINRAFHSPPHRCAMHTAPHTTATGLNYVHPRPKGGSGLVAPWQASAANEHHGDTHPLRSPSFLHPTSCFVRGTVVCSLCRAAVLCCAAVRVSVTPSQCRPKSSLAKIAPTRARSSEMG
jgi:hypothetical protein